MGFVRLTKPLGVIDNTVLLAVASDFAKDFIETRARESIISALTTSLSRSVRVAVTVDPSLEDAPAPAPEPEPAAPQPFMDGAPSVIDDEPDRWSLPAAG